MLVDGDCGILVVGFHWGDLVFLFCNSIFWEGGRDFEG
jgi:hypothetical protein